MKLKTCTNRCFHIDNYKGGETTAPAPVARNGVATVVAKATVVVMEETCGSTRTLSGALDTIGKMVKLSENISNTG